MSRRKGTPVEFAYEPILFTRTGTVFAYEQLVRLPGGGNAGWLGRLDPGQRAVLDREGVFAAQRATATFRRPVFVNVFPESFEAAAHTLREAPYVALEASETVPMDAIIDAIHRYPRLWLALDDATCRADTLAALYSSVLRHSPLFFKIAHGGHKTVLTGAFDLSLLPPTWTLVVEGVRPELLHPLWRAGVLFAQGNRLSRQRRSPSRLVLDIA